MEKLHGIKGIRVWMVINDMSPRKIAKKYGCTEPFASLFFNGKRTSQGLVDFLIKKGCPGEHFENGRVIISKDQEKIAA